MFRRPLYEKSLIIWGANDFADDSSFDPQITDDVIVTSRDVIMLGVELFKNYSLYTS